jgi:hypothetical protein
MALQQLVYKYIYASKGRELGVFKWCRALIGYYCNCWGLSPAEDTCRCPFQSYNGEVLGVYTTSSIENLFLIRPFGRARRMHHPLGLQE